MLDIAINELKRHKMRSFLTGLGIVIAIAAIVSLGSISEGMNLMVGQSLSQIGADKIMVTKQIEIVGFGSPQIPTLDEDLAAEFEQISGVEEALPLIRTTYLGSIPVVGADERQREFMQLNDLDFKEGGWYDDTDTDSVAVGVTFAESRNLAVGDSIKINNHEMTIVGIIEGGEMRGANLVVAMPYAVAQDIFNMEGKATVIVIKPVDITQADNIKNEIRDGYDDLEASTSEDLLKRSQEIIGTLSIVTFGIGLIASMVAALGIIITMITSISERKRQIGVMKAIGAKRRAIIKQVLQESILLAVISGAAGLMLGYLLVGVLNQAFFAGMNLAAVTPQLAVGAFAYGVILSLVSAIYPAWKASKVDPIEAIRS